MSGIVAIHCTTSLFESLRVFLSYFVLFIVIVIIINQRGCRDGFDLSDNRELEAELNKVRDVGCPILIR